MPSMPTKSNPQGDSRSASSGSSGADSKKKNNELPPLFWYMEMGDWTKATSRANRHPREVKTWATLRTKSMATDGTGGGTVSGTKRLALHHACFKLRSSSSSPFASDPNDDPFLENCRFVMMLLKLNPDAAGMRESRHGCLPLHLAAFASSAPRNSEDETIGSTVSTAINSPGPATPTRKPPATLPRPNPVTVRSTSVSSTETGNTSNTGMTAVHAEERLTGSQTMNQMQEKSFRLQSPKLTARTRSEDFSPRRSSSFSSPQADPFSSSPASSTKSGTLQMSRSSEMLIATKREDMAVAVVNALLDAYPKGIRLDSEGGRLPLHTACAGRATPKVVATLLTAYPAGARQRNKDGFLPLHLAAHWGVSHPSVAVALLKAYPDATVGRNRWERTPLEEALCMAGENGRPHQAALVRALRKHPTYWTLPSTDMLRQPSRSRNLVDIDAAGFGDDSSTEENKEHAGDDPLGIMGRLTPRTKAKKQLSSPRRSSELPQNANLQTLIKNQRWRNVLQRLESHPTEACQEYKVMTRGGFVAVNGFTPLHYALERRPPHQVVEALIRAYPDAVTMSLFPSGALPLHTACTWEASPQGVSLLIASAPAACKVHDELGNLPLHCACFSGAVVNVVDSLLRAHPKSVLTRNNQGSLPEDICKRLRHDNSKVVLGLIMARKEVVMHHRRSRSSGDAAMAVQAIELTNRPIGKKQEGAGVNVKIEGNGNGKEELVWI